VEKIHTHTQRYFLWNRLVLRGEKNSLVLEKKGWDSFEESTTTTLVNCHLNVVM
jgi:hypothetical protein